VVHQRTPHSPLVASDHGSSIVRSLPHAIYDPRHGRERTRRCTHADIVQVGFLCFRRSDTPLCRVSLYANRPHFTLADAVHAHSFSILFSGLRSRLLQTHKSVYVPGAVYLAIVWMLYPICWAFSEGANVLTVDHEMIFYSILDLFAGPLFLFLFLASLRDVDYDNFGLQSGKASDYVNVSPVEDAREARPTVVIAP
jgi:hypothetical protein